VYCDDVEIIVTQYVDMNGVIQKEEFDILEKK
jgi:hypothetical protein